MSSVENSIKNTEITDEHIANERYKYQEGLTKILDDLDQDFTQEIINEIVLWKINRYAKLSGETILKLNELSKEVKEIDVDYTKTVLKLLLNTHGVRLPMASTILRFKNPNIYQIIDQRVYRFIYPDEDLTKIKKDGDSQIEIYLNYLKDLRKICDKHKIPFDKSDRILYTLDKDLNKKNIIKV